MDTELMVSLYRLRINYGAPQSSPRSTKKTAFPLERLSGITALIPVLIRAGMLPPD